MSDLNQRNSLEIIVAWVQFGSHRGFPIAGATFTQDGYLLQKIAASNVGTLGLVLVLLIRLYSGWGYAGSRLQSKVIEYEGTNMQISGKLQPCKVVSDNDALFCWS